MAVKMFILGLPGSGKSAIYRHIVKYLMPRYEGWTIARVNDYALLREMFQDDIKHEQFRPADHGGFDILDLTVFDTALKVVEERVQSRMSSKENELILIEFARNDYYKALKQFTPSFLRDSDSYFLFIDSDLETCKQRIHERVAHHASEDDNFVSDYIFDAYYCEDNKHYMSCNFKTEYRVNEQYVRIINNRGSLMRLEHEVDDFIDFVLSHVPLPV